MDNLLLGKPNVIIVMYDESDTEIEEYEPFFGLDEDFIEKQRILRFHLTDLLFRKYDRLMKLDEKHRKKENFEKYKQEKIKKKIYKMKNKCKNLNVLIKNQCPHCFEIFQELDLLREHMKPITRTRSGTRSRCPNSKEFLKLKI